LHAFPDGCFYRPGPVIPTVLLNNVMDEFEGELEFESWEVHYDLHQQEDWPALVEYCESEVRRRPDDLHAAERLADAYLRNGDYEKAIEFTGKIHREEPDIPSFQHRILDALRALGKNESDFDWTISPKIIRLTPDIADCCYEFLRPKRKPRSIFDLTSEIGQGEYLNFSDDDLLQYLKLDTRFDVDGDHPATADISIARRKSRTKP
jgi:tetratricopeptide (TPR) repeat protein